MSINHKQSAAKPHFFIRGKACRSMLFLDNETAENRGKWPCKPDVLAFGDGHLAQQNKAHHSTLPFLLCLSAQLPNDAFAETLTQRMNLKPDALILTGAASVADCQRLDALLRVEESSRGMADGEMPFLLLLGLGAAGFARSVEMANSSKRLIAIGQDSQTIVDAIGATSQRAAEPVLNTTRAHIQLAAASAGICAFEVLGDMTDNLTPETLINRGFGALASRDPKNLTLLRAFSSETRR